VPHPIALFAKGALFDFSDPTVGRHLGIVLRFHAVGH